MLPAEQAVYAGKLLAKADAEIDAILHGGQLDDERLEYIAQLIVESCDDPLEVAESITMNMKALQS